MLNITWIWLMRVTRSYGICQLVGEIDFGNTKIKVMGLVRAHSFLELDSAHDLWSKEKKNEGDSLQRLEEWPRQCVPTLKQPTWPREIELLSISATVESGNWAPPPALLSISLFVYSPPWAHRPWVWSNDDPKLIELLTSWNSFVGLSLVSYAKDLSKQDIVYQS